MTLVQPGHSGNNCLQADVPFTGSGWQEYWLTQTFPVAPGQYNYWLWRKYVNGWDVWGEMYWIYDAGGAEIYYSGWNTGDRHGASDVTDPDGFFRLNANQTVYRLVVPENGATMKIATASLSGDGAQITQLIDDLILEPIEPALGTITGRFVDTNDNGVASVYVGYKGSPNGLWDGAKNDWTITDENGYYTITAPIGQYYLAAYKDGYAPSADEKLVVNTGGITADTITLATAKDNLIYQRADLLVGSEIQETDTLDNAVDGNLYSLWRAKINVGYEGGAEFGPPQYLIAAFDGASDISDIVLYRECNAYFGDAWQSYEIDIMYSGTPLDPASWDDEASNIQTIYGNSYSTYGANIQSMVGLCAIPLDIQDALGVRIRFNNAHWAWKYAHVADLQIHGEGMYKSVQSIGEARTKPVDTPVAVGGKQLTALCNSDGAERYGVPANTAYIEENDRSSGIRLDVTGLDISTIQVGDTSSSLIAILGTVKETSAGEKYIQCDKIRWIEDIEPKIPAVGMNNRFAGTKMAEGLFVKVWGIATYVDATETTATYMLDDGSGKPIKLYTAFQTYVPEGVLIRVRGVLSIDAENTVLYMTEIMSEQ
jgi:hypothetical protein